MKLTHKQNSEITKVINKYPDYLSIHDQYIIDYKKENNSITFRFALCGIGYYYNSETLGRYWRDKDSYFVVDEVFYGIKNYSSEGDLNDVRGELVLNNDYFEEDKKMRFVFSNDYEVAVIRFEFESFEWNIIGEFAADEMPDFDEYTHLPPEQWHWLLKL